MDFISIMTYDLHGSWESTCGHNSPLFPRSGETGIERYLNLVCYFRNLLTFVKF
jgi:chitinase